MFVCNLIMVVTVSVYIFILGVTVLLNIYLLCVFT